MSDETPGLSEDEVVSKEQAFKDQRDRQLRDAIAKEFDDNTLKELLAAADQMTTAILYRILAIKADGGDTTAFKEAVIEFSNALYGRVVSVNLNPNSAIIALSGATALMTAEPLSEFEGSAREMANALTQRYGRSS